MLFNHVNGKCQFKQHSEKNTLYGHQSSRFAQYLAPPLFLIFLGILFFSSAGRDDPYISYWSSYSLAHFGEILNYNGEHIEQGSSLLHVLVLAFVNVLSGVPIPTLGRILSVLWGVFSLAAVYRLALKVCRRSAFYATLLTATSAYFIYWSFGGLESTLVSLTILWLILTYGAYITESRKIDLVCSIAATALFAAVRPEAPIVLICLLVGTITVVYLKQRFLPSNQQNSGQMLTRLSKLLLIAIAICILLFSFRISYFNSLFPQPVFAKSTGLSLRRFDEGIRYLARQILMTPSLAIIVLAAAVGMGYALKKLCTGNHFSPYVLLSLVFLGVYISFISFSGGDWMEAGRFIVHMLPIAVIFIPFLLDSLIKSKVVLKVIFLLLLALQMHTVIYLAKVKSTAMPLWSAFDHYKSFPTKYAVSDFTWFERSNRVHLRDIPTIYQLNDIVERLLAHKKDEVLIMSQQMGMVPYYIVKKHFGRVHTLDRKGLTDRTFTKSNIASTLRRSPTGLDLHYQYYFNNLEVLDKKSAMAKPDIIFDLFSDASVLQVMVKHGYTLFYLQTGLVYRESDWLHGKPINANQFIVVRNDLTAALADFQKTKLIFQQSQPWLQSMPLHDPVSIP